MRIKHLLKNKDVWYLIVLISIGLSGVLLRAVQYLHNRSLWLDEAFLAMNILDRSFMQLLEPLDYNQGSPVGFILVTKVLVKAFGPGEYVFRLFPFLSGIATIFLFYLLARRFLQRKAVAAALFLLCFSPALIYYSSEFKQYGSDALISLMLLLLTFYYDEWKEKWWANLFYISAGAIAVWFSHPAVFTLAGAGLTFAIDAIRRKKSQDLFRILFVGATWLLSIAILYTYSLRELSQNRVLEDFWLTGFAPFPPRSFNDLKWYLDSTMQIFDSTAQMPLKGISFFSLVLGCFAFFRMDRKVFSFFLAPFLFILTASALHLYPFENRLMMFVIPLFLLLVVKGIEFLGCLLSGEKALITVILFGLIAFYPAYDAVQIFWQPRNREEIREVISYARKNWQDGDIFYVYYAAEAPFKYYARMTKIPESQYVIGKEVRTVEGILADVAQFTGKRRIWFIYSHPRGNDLTINLTIFRTNAQELRSNVAQGAGVYLYELVK